MGKSKTGRQNAKAKPGDKRIDNQWWKLRSKHGRDPIFASPELMRDAAYEYFDWCQNNPFNEIDYRSGKYVTVPKMRPFTIEGFCLYIGANTKYFNEFKDSIAYTTKGFSHVYAEIQETIKNQQVSGAQAGFLNAAIVARINSISDKVESKVVAEISQQSVIIERKIVKK